MSRNKNRNQDPSKSGTRLNHSAYTIEDGHGGLKRNRGEGSRYGKYAQPGLMRQGMDPMTRGSQELMGDEPRSFYSRETGRWHANRDRQRPQTDKRMADTQSQVQTDAQSKINRSMPMGRESSGMGGAVQAPRWGSSGGGGGGKPRGIVTITDIK